MDRFITFISEKFSVDIDDIEFEFKTLLFFSVVTFTILGISFLLNISLLNAILIITFSNRLFDREHGFHASNLRICYVTSTIFYVICIALSTFYTINPIIVLIMCCVILYDEIDSNLIFVTGAILIVSMINSNYLYLSNCLFYSMIYAYISSNRYTLVIMNTIDKALQKINVLK
jgi:hypothetical protein